MVLFHASPFKSVETRTVELAEAGWWVRIARDQAGYLEVSVLTRSGKVLVALDTSGGQAKLYTYDKGNPRGTHPAGWT